MTMEQAQRAMAISSQLDAIAATFAEHGKDDATVELLWASIRIYKRVMSHSTSPKPGAVVLANGEVDEELDKLIGAGRGLIKNAGIDPS